MYELFKNLAKWLVSGDQWAGTDGIAHRIAEHLEYSLIRHPHRGRDRAPARPADQ